MCRKSRLRAGQGDARAGLRAQVVEVGGLDAVVGACETSLCCVNVYFVVRETFGLQWFMSILKSSVKELRTSNCFCCNNRRLDKFGIQTMHED